MQAKLPVLAVTDHSTDIGKVIVEGGFGWWCESDDINEFSIVVTKMRNENLIIKGIKSFEYLKKNYSVDLCYKVIEKYLKI